MSAFEIWEYRAGSGVFDDPEKPVNLTGYSVEASDGGIGKVDEATYEVGSSRIVVDTGPWIFGKKVVLPAGVIERVDRDDETVYVSRTKDQIKDSPRFGEGDDSDESYRDEIGSYYGTGGPGFVG